MFWIKTCQRFGTVKYEGDDQNNLWIDIALGESKTVNGLRILPRNGAVNGVIVEYRIEVSMITDSLIMKWRQEHGQMIQDGNGLSLIRQRRQTLDYMQ
mgnify:CR=1 FL=1